MSKRSDQKRLNALYRVNHGGYGQRYAETIKALEGEGLSTKRKKTVKQTYWVHELTPEGRAELKRLRELLEGP